MCQLFVQGVKVLRRLFSLLLYNLVLLTNVVLRRYVKKDIKQEKIQESVLKFNNSHVFILCTYLKVKSSYANSEQLI